MCYSFNRMGDMMKNIKRQLIVNVLIIAVAIFLFKEVSYSADNNPTDDNKDLLISTGNMQVVLNIPNEKYELLGNTKILSDTEGKKQDGYTFTIKNTGNIPIEYYEIRLVDQEGKISTLPHKYLRFIINKDGGKYEDIKNLGDNDSILYYGYNLGVGDTSSYNVKIWIDSNEIEASGKELYGALEVTLYQKFDVYKNYVLYESPDSTNVPIRTNVNSPISSTIPKKEGYKFLGWEKKNATRRYQAQDTYLETIGTTLYAVWEKE